MADATSTGTQSVTSPLQSGVANVTFPSPPAPPPPVAEVEFLPLLKTFYTDAGNAIVNDQQYVIACDSTPTASKAVFHQDRIFFFYLSQSNTLYYKTSEYLVVRSTLSDNIKSFDIVKLPDNTIRIYVLDLNDKISYFRFANLNYAQFQEVTRINTLNFLSPQESISIDYVPTRDLYVIAVCDGTDTLVYTSQYPEFTVSSEVSKLEGFLKPEILVKGNYVYICGVINGTTVSYGEAKALIL